MAGKDNHVSGYPDIMIVQGTNDIFYPDVQSFFDKLTEAGVNATLVLGEGFWHVFAVDDILEKETVLNYIADFCSKQPYCYVQGFLWHKLTKEIHNAYGL